MLTGLLDQTADVYRSTWAKDEEGGKTRSRTALASGLACAVQPAAVSRQAEHARQGSTTTHHLYAASDPGVIVGDEVAWSGRTLIVQGPALDQGGRGVLWRIDLEERR